METYQALSSSNSKGWRFFSHGLVFGSSGAGLSLLFMLVTWGRWYPLYMSVPATILDGILGGVGYRISSEIGQTAKKITWVHLF